MADKELLELAARAVGLPECGWMGPAFVYVKDNTFEEWNPLDDDGDALRLAVKLDMRIQIAKGSYFSAISDIDGKCYEGVAFEFDDPYSATRRAIVRAAAEIGKAMEDQ